MDADDLTVVEVGGTAGEPEHEIVLEGLRRHAGQPARHLHVTAIVRAVDGRPTSKPAQVGMSRLAIAPDVVMVRGITADLDVLRVVLPRATRVVALVEQPEAPEAAAWAAIEAAGLLSWADLSLSPPFALQPSEGEVCVVGDQPAASRFNLWWRIRLWSHGRLRVRFGQPSERTLGVVLVGAPDAPAPAPSAGRAVLDLRLPSARPRSADAMRLAGHARRAERGPRRLDRRAPQGPDGERWEPWSCAAVGVCRRGLRAPLPRGEQAEGPRRAR